MKSLLLLSLVLVVSTQVNAQEQQAYVELGQYKAVDAETQTTHSDFVLRADGTVNFKIRTPDFTMPEPGCEGTYKVEGHKFTAHLQCPTAILPEAIVEIDITNVTPESIRSVKGAEVDVTVDALSEEPVKYLLHKNDPK